MVKWLPTWFKLRNIIVLALACVVFATGSPGQTWLVRQSDEGVSTPARGTKSELGNAVLAQAEPTSMGSSNTPFEADAAQRANVSAVESAQRAAEAQEAELQAMGENYERTIAFIKAIKEFIQSAFGQAFARRPHVLLAAQPTKRFVTVAEIVGLVRFLCGDDAKSITGAMLPIDGGWTAE